MDQTKRRISANAVIRRVDGECQALRVLVPFLLIHIYDVHLQRSGQRLRHPFRRFIGLRPIRHSGTLPLSCDAI